MNQPSPADTGLKRSDFEKACVYCGARLRVEVARKSRHDAMHDYACAECGKTYEMQAALPPVVFLVTPRNDGKTDRYQETMF